MNNNNVEENSNDVEELFEALSKDAERAETALSEYLLPKNVIASIITPIPSPILVSEPVIETVVEPVITTAIVQPEPLRPWYKRIFGRGNHGRN